MTRLILYLVALGSLALSLACGVKGDPVPPATPAEYGVGKPVIKPQDSSQPLPKKPFPEYDQKNDSDDDDDN